MVNMRMAEYANAPVLLVGDIDHGGRFASLIGTMEIFSEAERARVQGFLINRFRGDPALLGDAQEYMRQRTGRPALGVVAFLQNLALPEEDSAILKYGGTLPFQIAGHQTSAGPNANIATQSSQLLLDIALIDLPHISNFTDCDPLAIESDVRLRIVRRPEDLGTPNAFILPGTKRTAHDLAVLRESGLAAAIAALAHGASSANQTEIIGICGGFQMLGTWLHDPDGVKTQNGSGEPSASIPGLGLLPLETKFAVAKSLRRVQCRHIASGLPVTGYEIHHGQSRIRAAEGGVSLFAEPNGNAGELIGPGRLSVDLAAIYRVMGL